MAVVYWLIVVPYKYVMARTGKTVFGAPPPTKTCPACLSDDLNPAATRCKHCGADIGKAAAFLVDEGAAIDHQDVFALVDENAHREALALAQTRGLLGTEAQAGDHLSGNHLDLRGRRREPDVADRQRMRSRVDVRNRELSKIV